MKVSSSYEDKMKKSYSDLHSTHLGGWAYLIDGPLVFNAYTDPEYVERYFTRNIPPIETIPLKIADFGGGDGILGHIVGGQLGSTERLPELFNIDSNPRSLKYCRDNYPEIKTIKQDLLEPLKKDFFDVGLSRFSVQYCSKAEQPKIIKNIYNSLKKGGFFVLSWPYGEMEREYNNITAEIKAVISDRSVAEQKTSRHNYLPGKMSLILEGQGFVNVSFKDGGYLLHSVSSWAERFKLTVSKVGSLRAIYEKYYEATPELFECIDREIYLITKVAFLYATKP